MADQTKKKKKRRTLKVRGKGKNGMDRMKNQHSEYIEEKNFKKLRKVLQKNKNIQ